jgi:proliferating cell nuclear antigen
MKLVLADSRLLKDAIAIISELVTEARFSVSKEAVTLVALDPATVAMVDFKLLASAFSEYDIGSGEDISLNLMNLKQVLRRAGSGDSLLLETQENKLKIVIKGASTRTFHLPLIEVEEGRRQIPKIDYAVTVTTTSQQLADAIDDADIVAESVAFTAKEKLFSIIAEGDLSKVNIDIPQDEDTKIVLEDSVSGQPVKAPVKARYSIEYLKKMVQGAKLSDKVSAQFRTDHPLRLEYKTLNKVSLTFILAPRVEND